MQRWKTLRGGVLGRGVVRELRRSFGSSAIRPHESKRARYNEGKGECEGPSGCELHGVHVFQCRVSNGFWGPDNIFSSLIDA